MAGTCKWLALLCAGALGACTSVSPDGMQARSACNSEPGGWCSFTTQMALESYEYAQLSQNAYEPDHETYAVLHPDIAMRALVPNDEYGFAYAVFDRLENGQLTEVILAFRGTEFGSWDDWWHGNIGTLQRERGVQLYHQVRDQLDDAGWSDVPISVTGHSLGGAIAAEVSLRNSDVKMRIFNSSPHFSDTMNPAAGDRMAISERGEFLQLLRRAKNFPGQDSFILDCNPGDSSFADHKMRRLGDCLIWIAAYQDAVAHGLLEDNGVLPPKLNRYCDDAGNLVPHPGQSETGPVIMRLCQDN